MPHRTGADSYTAGLVSTVGRDRRLALSYSVPEIVIIGSLVSGKATCRQSGGQIPLLVGFN